MNPRNESLLPSRQNPEESCAAPAPRIKMLYEACIVEMFGKAETSRRRCVQVEPVTAGVYAQRMSRIKILSRKSTAKN